ncbi:MAG: dihydrolipoyl dehydrogenase [Phycisphaerae bacterium]|nr:dihydrolipoyl dehydrogenase [Phycisphaerae bacterium]
MTGDDLYDVAILGAGPGGLSAAMQVARRGGAACVIESGHAGGTCLNVGCMPTKAMLAASGLCRQIGSCDRFGLSSSPPVVDAKAFMRRVSEVVATLREKANKALTANKRITLVRGRGRLVDANTLAVQTADGDVRVSARSVIIATGSRPARPGFFPWDNDCVITSDDAATAADLPQSVLIVGGGVIGCEFATVYSELGVKTYVVEMLDRLLPELETEASAAVSTSLSDRGVEVLTARRVASVAADGSVELDDGRTIQVHRVLVAVGRQANIADIGLEDVGVEIAGGVIAVDSRCRTNIENIYAVGDAAEARQYAHLADRMGLVAADNAMGHDLADDRVVVPVGAYTHPEIASVGVNLADAREQFGSARVFRYSYRNSGMALVCGQSEGQVKLIADAESGAIYGALWIGSRATDMIAEIALAMRNGLTLEHIHRTIHPHPTFQEAAGAIAAAWSTQAMRK